MNYSHCTPQSESESQSEKNQSQSQSQCDQYSYVNGVYPQYWECLWGEMLELTLQLRREVDLGSGVGVGNTGSISVSMSDNVTEKQSNTLCKSLSKTIHTLRHHYQDSTTVSNTPNTNTPTTTVVTNEMKSKKQLENEVIVSRAMNCLLLDSNNSGTNSNTSGSSGTNNNVTNLNTVQCFEGVLLLVS